MPISKFQIGDKVWTWAVEDRPEWGVRYGTILRVIEGGDSTQLYEVGLGEMEIESLSSDEIFFTKNTEPVQLSILRPDRYHNNFGIEAHCNPESAHIICELEYQLLRTHREIMEELRYIYQGGSTDAECFYFEFWCEQTTEVLTKIRYLVQHVCTHCRLRGFEVIVADQTLGLKLRDDKDR